MARRKGLIGFVIRWFASGGVPIPPFPLTGRARRRRCGWVAELCPSCRSAQQFRVVDVEPQHPLRDPETGEERAGWYELVCRACGLRLRERWYVPKWAEEAHPLPVLAAWTNPSLDLEPEPEPPPDPREREERMQWIFDDFEEVARAEARYLRHEPLLSVGSRISILLLALLVPVLFFLASRDLDDAEVIDELPWLSIAALLLGSAGTLLYLRFSALKRFVRRKIGRWLARALASLRPKPAELQHLLRSNRGTLLARWLDPRSLHAALISDARAGPPGKPRRRSG